MKYYGKPKIEKIEKRSCEYLRCDACHKKLKDKYYEVDTGHNDWGNDSIDSFKNYDICEDCISDFVSDYLIETKKSYTAHIKVESACVHNKSYYGNYDNYEDMLVEEDKYNQEERADDNAKKES